MIKAVKTVINIFSVKVFITCLTVVAPLNYNVSKPYTFKLNQALAQTHDNILTGSESYLDRPDILNIPPQEQNLGNNWENLKAAHFSFVAELLALYSADTHIYFLARDSEHLYDVARMVTENTNDFNRIHLLNVSRANMRDPNIKGYLAEYDISEQSLTKGKKVLFVDTGFSGTIPRVIAENFSTQAKAQLKTHLVVSSNPNHPSARSFLIHLNPSVNEQSPSQMHSSIISYEHMPRYTDRSDRYVLSNGLYHPISSLGRATDGSVSKEQSLKYMSDLKAEWQKPETKTSYHQEKMQFEKLKLILTQKDEKALFSLKEQLENSKNTPIGRLLEAQIKDIYEAKHNAGIELTHELTSLGLENVSLNSSFADSLSKKNELIKKYPEWAPILENPDDSIPKLFIEQNWQMIGNLIDANVDREFNKLIIKSLYDSTATGIKKELQINMIEKGDAATLVNLACYTFSLPHTKNMTDLLRLLIEKGDVTILQYLARHTFSKPHTKEMTDLLKLVIEKGDAKTMQYLAVNTFSQPHTKEMTDLLRLVIEKGDASTMHILAEFTFSKPHTNTPVTFPQESQSFGIEIPFLIY